jgi:hypothetical protein
MLEENRANAQFLLLLLFLILFRLMLVNIVILLLQFEKCIANDICDGGTAHFVTFPPAGSTNKRVCKVCLASLSYPTAGYFSH